MQVTMTVNGEEVTREIEGRLLLVHFLRDHLGLTGTHWGCDTSNCGTCVVWLDGEPVKSCTVLAAMAGGHEVRTVEGLEQDGELDPVQRGLHGVPRPAVRLLHAGDDDDRPGAARPQPRPDRAGDPRGDLRPDLPLHRLRHDRPLGAVGRRHEARPRHPQPSETVGERVVTTIEDAPDARSTDNDQKPVGHGRMLRKEDPRFIRGKGHYVDDIQLPGMLHLAILRSPVAHARIVSIDTTRRRRRTRR